MSDNASQPEFYIPGYEFIERLGSGGYGEVWRVEVPGGIQKAVKVVFGRFDQQRAAAELRAMERIKALRHPFLLSLERIEIIDNRLVIVTELAEGSLRDRYLQCREEGLPGIPREELLGYLSDAADALDYICQQHELQHLDVKPENLLLVAGHAKLADFGLVKDLYTTQASVVGGMTPTYAAPELFQGHATASSDQYSLAILYQELLTGAAPFQGPTAAELTLQHLSDTPNLDSLDESDRFAISQSLAKQPEHRFASCKDLVAALSKSVGDTSTHVAAKVEVASDHTASPSPASFANASGEAGGHGATQLFDASNADWSNQSQPVLLDLLPASPCKPQAVPEVDSDTFAVTPAVVIGLGSTAGQVLRNLRSQIAASHGTKALNVVRTMLIDTDPKSIRQATSDGHSGLALAPSDTLCIPLKRPNDYRNTASRLLRWMSRRWLYNIPRSLRTEGIRPLGRLALIDHARQVCQRVRLLLQEASDPAAVEALQQAAGLPMQTKALRVYLVGAVSGGTAGGVLIDVAYLVRDTLTRLGVDQSNIIGIAAHATSRELDAGELARVNSYAWLNELQHFSRNDVAYPGDESAGFPSQSPEVAPFDSVYVVDMGDRIDQVTFQAEVASIANYLYIDALTPAQTYLDACRNLAIDKSNEAPHELIRSFTLATEAGLSEQAISSWTRALSKTLFERWTDCDSLAEPSNNSCMPLPEEQTTGPVIRGIGTLLSQQQLDSASLSAACRAAIEAYLGGDVVHAVRDHALRAGYSPETLTLEKGVEFVDKLLCLDEQGEWLFNGANSGPVAKHVAQGRGAALESWILERIDTPCDRIPAARRSIEFLDNHLESERIRLRRVCEALQYDSAKQPGADLSSDDVGRAIVKVLRNRLDHAATSVAIDALDLLQQSLDSIGRRLDAMQKSLTVALAQASGDAEGACYLAVESGQGDVAMALHSLANELDIALQDSNLTPAGGFLAVCESGDLLSNLDHWTKEVATQLVAGSAAVKKLSQSTFVQSPSACTSDNAGENPLVRLNQENGSCCWVRVQNESVPREPTSEFQVTVVAAVPDTYTIAEAWGLSIQHVGSRFVAGRRDYAQLASRVHTRCDVEWSTLLDKPEQTRINESTPPPTVTDCMPTQMVVPAEVPVS